MQDSGERIWSRYAFYGPIWIVGTAAGLFLWPGLLKNFLLSDDFMPHGGCYLWLPSLVRLHVTCDLLIGLSYTAISSTLAYLVYKARFGIPFPWVFLAFGLFIVACGGTHFMEVWTVWHPHYWAAGGVKLVTAAASMATALVLPSLVPQVLNLIEAAKQGEEHKAQLEAANAQLASANEELEAFSYTIAHDLKAPLRAIDGYSRILLEEASAKLASDEQSSLNRIGSNAQRMAHLIDDLLNFSRLTRREIQASEIDMGHLVQAVFEELKSENPGRSIRLAAGPMPKARGDLPLIRQVVENLLSNAVKFTGRKLEALIEVGGRRKEAKAIYYVKDNGIGIDMRYAGKLFGIFQRLHPHGEFEGTGVGLAIVKRIIQRHGGRVWAESKPDQGATFYFTLPSPGGSK